MTTVDELFNEASFLRHKNAEMDVMQITREEAQAIIRILSQARHDKPLSSVELDLILVDRCRTMAEVLAEKK